MLAPRVVRRELLIPALIFYGVALVLVLLAVTVVDGEAEDWLFKVAFYMAIPATVFVLGCTRKRRD